MVATPTGSLMFTTTAQYLDTSLLVVDQPEGYSGESALVQSGNRVVVSGTSFDLFEDKGEEPEQKGSYENWTQVVSAINLLNNKNAEYIVKLKYSIDIGGKLTMPTKAKKITISGGEDSTTSTLSYLGDFSAVTNTEFVNVVLNPVDSAGKQNVKSKFAVNGYEVKLNNSNFIGTIDTISGSTKGKLYIDGTKQTSKPVITLKTFSVPYFEGHNVSINTTATISVGTEAILDDVDLDAGTSVTIKDIVSNSPNNTIAYGSVAKDIIKITGTVNTDTYRDCKVNKIDGQAVDNVKVNYNSITIRNKFIEKNDVSNYVTDANKDKNLIDGKAVYASFFVIGKSNLTEDETGYSMDVAYTTKKVGQYLRVDKLAEKNIIEIQETRKSYSGENGEITTIENITVGYAGTLKEAFNFIDSIATKSKYYRLIIDPTKADQVSSLAENITTPKKAGGVIIEYADIDGEKKPINVKDTITLNCDLDLDGISIADNKVIKNNKETSTLLNFKIGSYILELNNVTVSGDRIGSITGGGVGGYSSLSINNSGVITNEK